MCSRKYSPAEADAILWAVQLALSEGWDIIIFGGDSKIFFDLTIIPWLISAWSNSSIITNILCIVESFSSCSFQ